MASSSCVINWAVQASEDQGDGTYKRELTPAEYAACDPGGANGIYADTNGNTTDVASGGALL